MDEESKIELADRFSVEYVLDRLTNYISPAHRDSEGKIDPRHEKEELNTKLAYIDTSIYIWGKKTIDQQTIDEMARRGIEMVLKIFPERKNDIGMSVRKSKNLSQYADILEKRDEVTP